MTPTDMTRFGAEGDCWRACVATLTDFPIGDVPHFMLDAFTVTHRDAAWRLARANTEAWLAERGLALRPCRAEVTIAAAEDTPAGELARFEFVRFTYCARGFHRVRERYGIVTGTTVRTNPDNPVYHSVVGDLTLLADNRADWLFHDPHPARTGLLLFQDVFTIGGAS